MLWAAGVVAPALRRRTGQPVKSRGTLALSLFLSGGLLAAAVSAPALASSPHSGMHPEGTKITTVVTAKYGRVLANSKGRVMYMFLTDKSSTSHCNGACARIWPHVKSKVKPDAGKHVSGKHLRRNSKGQVTYFGHPLYYFADGRGTSGEGLNRFFLVSIHGTPVKPKKKTTPKPAGPSGPAEVTTDTAGGIEVITSKNGHTLYALDPNQMASACTAGCSTTWPPLLTKGAPTAGGDAMSSLLGTVKRPGGDTQVTYMGRPVYNYSGDKNASKANGEGLIGPYVSTYTYWYDITPAGMFNAPV